MIAMLISLALGVVLYSQGQLLLAGLILVSIIIEVLGHYYPVLRDRRWAWWVSALPGRIVYLLMTAVLVAAALLAEQSTAQIALFFLALFSVPATTEIYIYYRRRGTEQE
jgi:cytochrome b561